MSAADAASFTDVQLRRVDYKVQVKDLIEGESRHDMSVSELEDCVGVVTEDDVRQASEGFLQEDGEPAEALVEKLRQAGCGDFYGD